MPCQAPGEPQFIYVDSFLICRLLPLIYILAGHSQIFLYAEHALLTRAIEGLEVS